MDYLGGAIICSFLNAFLKLLENHALIQLSRNPELSCHLAPSVLCILSKEIRAGLPALAAAYAALSIYYYINHQPSPR